MDLVLDPTPSSRLRHLLADIDIEPRAVLDLSSGITDWPLSAAAAAALAGNDWAECAQLAGDPRLQAAMQGWLAREFNCDAAAQGATIIPTCGSKEGLAATCLWAIARGQRAGKAKVLLPEGSYYAYDGAIALAGGIAEPLALAATDTVADKIKAMPATDRDEICLVCYPFPVNPFARAETAAELLQLLALARQHDFLVLADECMIELTLDQRPPSFCDLAAHAGGWPQELVLASSLSKRSFASSLRAGCLVGATEIMEQLLLARGFVSPIMQLPVQFAAAELWGDLARNKQIQDHLAQSRNLLTDGLGGQQEIIFPPCGQYAWLLVEDDQMACRKAFERGVRTMPSSLLCKGARLQSWPRAIRLSLSAARPVLSESLPVLRGLC